MDLHHGLPSHMCSATKTVAGGPLAICACKLDQSSWHCITIVVGELGFLLGVQLLLNLQ